MVWEERLKLRRLHVDTNNQRDGCVVEQLMGDGKANARSCSGEDSV